MVATLKRLSVSSPGAEAVLAQEAQLLALSPETKAAILKEVPSAEILLTTYPIRPGEQADLSGIPFEASFWSLLPYIGLGDSPDMLSTFFGIKLLRGTREGQEFLRGEWHTIVDFLFGCHDIHTGGFNPVAIDLSDRPHPTLTATHFGVGALRLLRDIPHPSLASDAALEDRVGSVLSKAAEFIQTCTRAETGGFVNDPAGSDQPETNPTTAGLKLIEDVRRLLRGGAARLPSLDLHFQFLGEAFSPEEGGWRIGVDRQGVVCLCTTFFALLTLRSFSRDYPEARRIYDSILTEHGGRHGSIHRFVLRCRSEDGGFVAIPGAHYAGLPFSLFALGILKFLAGSANVEPKEFIGADVVEGIANHLERCQVGAGLFALGSVLPRHAAMVYPTALVAKECETLRNLGILRNFDLRLAGRVLQEALYKKGGFLGIAVSGCKADPGTPDEFFSLKERGSREQEEPMKTRTGRGKNATTIDLESAAASVSEQWLARLTPQDRGRLDTLDHGDRSAFVPFDLHSAAASVTDHWLARLTPEEQERLKTLDHGDRDGFIPFDLETAAREVEERRPR